ncbi:MAG: hypothetical protein C5B46_00580 [Proteobacteria bacterium]|nr:MAG: hypothetical protein C5B46_00580 [Pseudomonadota bacterium]
MTLWCAGNAAASVVDFPSGLHGDSSECPPFGCATHYQQIYSVAPFQAATDKKLAISDLLFFNQANVAGLPANIDSGTFKIRLGLTTAPADGSVNSFVIPQDSALVFSGHLTAQVPFGGSLDIKIAPFVFDPSPGQNLVLDISKENSSPTAGGMDVLAEMNGLSGRVYEFPSGSITHDSGGLVTQFVFTPVPEPRAVMELCVGLAFIVALAMRRRTSA